VLTEIYPTRISRFSRFSRITSTTESRHRFICVNRNLPTRALRLSALAESTATYSEHAALPNHNCQIHQNHQHQSISGSTHSEHSARPNQNQQIHQNHMRAYLALPNQNHQIHSEHILLYPLRAHLALPNPEEPEALQTGAGPPEPGDSSDWGHQNQRTATNKRISQNEHNHQLGCLGTGNHDNKRISQNEGNHNLSYNNPETDFGTSSRLRCSRTQGR